MATAEIRPGKSLLRKVLHYSVHIPVSRKAPVMILTVSFLSIVAWLDYTPHFPPFLSDKRNAVNYHLVKWSWGWSLLCLIPSVMFTAFLYSALKLPAVLCHVSRLLVAHCVWFSTTKAFILLNSVVGICSDGSNKSYEECVKESISWNGFDISGHVFLLTYCIYVLTEEVLGLRWEIWREYETAIEHEYRVMNKQNKIKELLLQMHKLCSPFAQILEIFAASLMAIWVTMVITTSLYFHSVLEKLLGSLCGWLAWHVTYVQLYGRMYAPSRPDQGVLHPIKHLPHNHTITDN